MSTLERLNEVTLAVITPSVLEQFFADSPLLGYLRRR